MVLRKRFYKLSRHEAEQGGGQAVSREYKWRNLMQVTLFYLLGLVAIVGFYYAQDRIGVDIPFIVVVVVIFLGLSTYSIVIIRGHLDLMSSVERQNTMFSSALAEGKLFSMIVSAQEQMYYADSGFYELCPELAKRHIQVLDHLVKDSDDPLESKARLERALTKRVQEAFNIYISTYDGRIKARMTISPLQDAEGYFFVTARKFVERRMTGEGGLSPDEAVNNVLDVVLEAVEKPAYALDSTGNVRACNKAFAQMLGVGDANTLKQTYILGLVVDANQASGEQFASSAFDQTELSFRTRDKAIKKAYIVHHVLYGKNDFPWLTVGVAEEA